MLISQKSVMSFFSPTIRYGVKEVDGVKRLSGPGLETADVPGLMQGGGPWSIR